MLGGLRHIPDSSGTVNIYHDREFPTINARNYHIESLKIIEDKYRFEKPTADATIINLPGEPLIRADHVHPDTYIFLRNLYLSRIHISDISRKKIYLTRKDSGILNPANRGKLCRHILNEDEIIPDLNRLGYEIIRLEDYTFEEKVKLFNTASVIISPNSGGLTFSLFAGAHTKIIEILPSVISDHDHYKNICTTLGVQYHRFTGVTTTGDRPALGNTWNMILNKPSFINFIENL